MATGVLAGWAAQPGCFARNLIRPPNIPKLAPCSRPRPFAGRGRSRLANFAARKPSRRRSGTPLVLPSMTTPSGRAPRAGFSPPRTGFLVSACDRHATCLSVKVMEKVSGPPRGNVDLFHRVDRPAASDRGRTAARGVGDATSDRRRRWNLGAARNGHRKRTRVRVACGDAIRPRGVGTHPSHGHLGRSVVGNRLLLPPVVPRSDRRQEPRGRHLSRGPGLPAAALTSSPHVGFVRMPAPAGRTASATRRRSPVVNRATFLPAPTVGSSRGCRRRTRPDHRTRLRTV